MGDGLGTRDRESEEIFMRVGDIIRLKKLDIFPRPPAPGSTPLYRVDRFIQPPKKQTEMATLTRIVNKCQKPRITDLKARLEFARDVGYYRGLSDKHEEPRNFETGPEWLSWLAGWRAGQAELKAQRDAEVGRQEEIENSMMEEFLR
jgi:ribosome modulation factor